MRCPDCGKRLTKIPPCAGEWACLNDDCPANKRHHGMAHSEYYGLVQTTIDKQKHVILSTSHEEAKQ